MKGRERREGVGRRGGRLKWEGGMVEGGEWGAGVARGRRGGAICSQLKGGAADGGERSVGSNDQSAGHTEGFLF